MEAITAYARRNGYEIIDAFYDAAISGADPVTERPGFMLMMNRLVETGASTILVESPDRFARDLAVQLAGHDMLKASGIELVPTSAPDFFTEDTPTAVLVRQVLGAIAQFEKASVVAKLAAARKRKRLETGRCEGRKPLSQTNPEAVAIAKTLARRRKQPLSLRQIAAALEKQGHVSTTGKTFSAKSVAVMLQRS